MISFGPTPTGWENDPSSAAYLGDYFASQLRAVAQPIIPRLDSELLEDINSHSDPAVRENAMFEYVYRHERDAVPVLLKSWHGEENDAVRTSYFEELTRLDYSGLKLYLESSGIPKDTYPLAIAAYRLDPGKRETKTDPTEIFDQVLPLRIALREYVEVEPGKWMYHVFAPIQETRVAGQLYACSKVETRARQIVMTKHLEGLHSDGSLHLENTLFCGRTLPKGENTGSFSYATALRVPFYPSGRIGDQSEGIIRDALITVERSGTNEPADDILIQGVPAVNNVTGFIHAWGFTRPDRATFDASGRMDQIAGLFHLGSLLDPRIRDYVNTYTIGTYRGALAADEDGKIPLNTNPSYSTLNGEIDRNRDGVADEPVEQYDICPGIYPISHYTSNRS